MDPCKKYVFIKFHHRAAALHALCLRCYTQNHPLMPWLRNLAQAIPSQYFGQLPSVDILAKSTGLTLRMQTGTVAICFHDLVAKVRAMGNSGRASNTVQLESKLREEASDVADNVHDWVRMKDMCTRIGAEVWELINDFMSLHEMPIPPFPKKWLGEPFFLLEGVYKSGIPLTDNEQIVLTRRMLAQVLQISVNAQFDLSSVEYTKLLHRHDAFKVEKRKPMAEATKKLTGLLWAACPVGERLGLPPGDVRLLMEKLTLSRFTQH
jgi:hypothetical protein